MQLMEEMILKYGKVLPGGVLKVGSFLNQQIDSVLLRECAREIARLYADCGITKTDLLPYNPTWYFKNQKLGIETAPEIRSLNSFQSVEHINNCKSIFRDKNIEC